MRSPSRIFNSICESTKYEFLSPAFLIFSISSCSCLRKGVFLLLLQIHLWCSPAEQPQRTELWAQKVIRLIKIQSRIRFVDAALLSPRSMYFEYIFHILFAFHDLSQQPRLVRRQKNIINYFPIYYAARYENRNILIRSRLLCCCCYAISSVSALFSLTVKGEYNRRLFYIFMPLSVCF